jgi:putative transposase
LLSTFLVQAGPVRVAASPRSSALKTLYLVVRSLDPKGTGQTRWVTRWKPALNAFAITFADRIPAAEDH